MKAPQGSRLVGYRSCARTIARPPPTSGLAGRDAQLSGVEVYLTEEELDPDRGAENSEYGSVCTQFGNIDVLAVEHLSSNAQIQNVEVMRVRGIARATPDDRSQGRRAGRAAAVDGAQLADAQVDRGLG